MNANIIRQLNRQNTLDNMIPLSEFSGEEKIQELEKRGYRAGFTAESWKAEFPGIDPSLILCPQSLLFPASLIYLDPAHYICFNTYIFDGKMLFSMPSPDGKRKDARGILAELIARGMKDYEEKRYVDLLFPMTSEEGGGIAIRILREMLEREEPNPDLYSAFISVYTLCNCGAHLLGETALRRLVMCKSEKQKAETQKKLKKFPGDSLMVYRGQASESTPHEQACSWTTDINKAYFFASWRSADGSCILTGSVKKENIIDYIDSRDEKEVLVVPGTVGSVKKKGCIDWDMFQDIAAADMFDSRHRFPRESLARNIMKALDQVYEKGSAADHDKEHSLRVALLANFLFRMDVLMPLVHRDKAKYMKASSLLEDLSRATVYHDAGRTDNTSNPEHGAAGYEKYRQDHGENKVVEFLTTYHCRPDEEAREYWEKVFTGETAGIVWKAYCILKDADALDRVRFGRGSGDFLDVNILRSNTAKALVPVAFRLVDARFR